MGDFTFGDKIKGKDNNYDVTNEDMILAEVIGVDGDSMSIKVINHKDDGWVGHRFNVRNSLDDFELAEPTLSFSFKTDDGLWKELSGVTSLNISSADDSVDALSYCVNDYSITSKYVEKEEEINMNKVLRLWNDRQIESINKKYDELMKEYIEKHYEITSRYKELIETFEKDLEDLYKEENENKESESSILKENSTCNVYKYVVDEDSLRYEAVDLYREDKAQELDKQADKFKEIDALLSMSEDLEYQQEILVEYGIINKKTKRMI